jgi:hypothetical protein
LASSFIAAVLGWGSLGGAVFADEGPGVAGVENGCAIAIARTAGTRGAPHVQAACNRAVNAVAGATVPVPHPVSARRPVPAPNPDLAPNPATADVPATSEDAASALAGVLYGCGLAIANTAQTIGARFVQAACSLAISAVAAAPAPVPPGAGGATSGCAIAIAMTVGTAGQPWVRAYCGRADEGDSASP